MDINPILQRAMDLTHIAREYYADLTSQIDLVRFQRMDMKDSRSDCILEDMQQGLENKRLDLALRMKDMGIEV